MVIARRPRLWGHVLLLGWLGLFSCSTPSWAQLQSADQRPFRFEFEWGPINVRNLDLQSPPGSGTEISLEELELNLAATSQITFEWMFKPRHELGFYWAPLEFRDFDAVTRRDVSFDGVLFPAGEATVFRFLFHEYAFRYRYRLADAKRVQVDVGATASIRETRVTGSQEATDRFAEISDVEALLLLHGRVWVGLVGPVGFVAFVDWMRVSEDTRSSNLYLAIRWQVNDEWDVNVGYRGLDRRMESDELRNRFTFDNVLFTAGYRFGAR